MLTRAVERVFKLQLLIFAVKDLGVIKAAVRDGQRPDLTVIRGPETLVTLVTDWISRCWDEDPDCRPAFIGIYHFQY